MLRAVRRLRRGFAVFVVVLLAYWALVALGR